MQRPFHARALTVVILALALVGGLLAAPAPAKAARPLVQVAPNGAPVTIPGVNGWTSGAGGFEFVAATRVVAAAATGSAASLSRDLGRTLGAPVPVATDAARTGDVSLSIDATQTALGKEGYRIVVGDVLAVTAATETGLFRGTQTVLQWAALAGTTARLPGGIATDTPAYPIRAMGVCACIINISMETLESVMDQMAYYKMNELWLELKIESETLPLATFWSYYTAQQAAHITQYAKDRHIRIVAEVNSPGHMGPWISKYPDLQLTRDDGLKEPTRLDISKPVALSTVLALYEEYMAAFDTDGYWHMGADEYMLGVPGGVARFPQLLAAAEAKFGANATEQDLFIDFVNQVNAAVRADGRTLRIFNDGIPQQYNIARLDPSIIVEHWQNDPVAGIVGRSAAQLLADGHDLVNGSKLLYQARPSGLWRDPSLLWSDNWTPKSFVGEAPVNDTATPGKVLGAKFTIWPDNGPAMTERQVLAQIQQLWLFSAQAFWGSPRPVTSYAEFTALGNKLSRGPNSDRVDWDPVPNGTYAITAGGQYLTPGTSGTAPVTLGGTQATWNLTATADGYYTIRSAAGACLDMVGGTALQLYTPMDFGQAPTSPTCNSSRNLQKWWIKPVTGGFTLVNAITQLPLVATGGSVAQQDPNRQQATVFQLVGDGLSVNASAPSRLTAGQAGGVAIDVVNLSASDATDVTVSVSAPAGWTVDPASTTLGALARQASTSTQVRVTPSAGGASSATLVVTLSWNEGGQQRTSTVNVATAASCTTTPTSPEHVVWVSSEQDSNAERSPASNTIDGSTATFWHTEWDPSEDSHPHNLVVGFDNVTTMCALTLTPRQGTSDGARNGQIKDYELYATSDDTVAATTFTSTVPAGWGAPIAAGALPASQAAQWIPLAAPVTAKYLLLVAKSAQVGTQPWTTLAEFSVDVAPASSTPTATASPTASATATVTTTVTSTVTPTTTITPTVTTTATATVTATATTTTTATSTATVSTTATVTPSTSPTTSPSVTATQSPYRPGYDRSNHYTTPGLHYTNGRHWFTDCEPYGEVFRCRTDIWATQAAYVDGAYVQRTGWFFNNLTYLPAPRSSWVGNPLGHSTAWSVGGRQWYTECGTAATGKDACRSYIHASVVQATPKAGGGFSYAMVKKWVLNNIVLFIPGT